MHIYIRNLIVFILLVWLSGAFSPNFWLFETITWVSFFSQIIYFFSKEQSLIEVLQQSSLGGHIFFSQFVFSSKDITIVNEVCLQFYNKHPQVDCHNKPMFLTGDKICMTRNSLITLYEESDNGMKPVTAKKEEEEEIGGNLEDLSNFGADQEKEANADSTQKTEIEEKKEKNIRLCNGEVFFIKDVSLSYTDLKVKAYIQGFFFIVSQNMHKNLVNIY